MDTMSTAQVLGNLGEFVGAIGVVATLIYHARQFRQSILDAKADANMQLGRDYLNHQRDVASNDNLDSFLKGLESFAALAPEERVKFNMCMTGYVNVVEATLMMNVAGRAHDELEMQQQYLSSRPFSYPGFEEWWRYGKGSGFGRPTQDWIDHQIDVNRGGSRFWHQSLKPMEAN